MGKLKASLINRCILSATMSTRCELVFDISDVAAELDDLHSKFVVLPSDKASNNTVFVCKTHYVNCLREELGLNTLEGNPTNTYTSLSKKEFLRSHKMVLLSFGISGVVGWCDGAG